VIGIELSLAATIGSALSKMHKLIEFNDNCLEYEVKRLQLRDHQRKSLRCLVVVSCRKTTG
jgi:hypothetical protein